MTDFTHRANSAKNRETRSVTGSNPLCHKDLGTKLCNAQGLHNFKVTKHPIVYPQDHTINLFRLLTCCTARVYRTCAGFDVFRYMTVPSCTYFGLFLHKFKPNCAGSAVLGYMTEQSCIYEIVQDFGN